MPREPLPPSAPPPALGTMTDSDAVISLGSFSKILAPAMRLGWIQASPKLRKSILANGYINSGGSINHISSHVARHAIELGLLDDHVQDLRRAYRSRVEAMDEVLRSEFSSLAEWNMPEGGYFFWLRVDESIDSLSVDLLDKEWSATITGAMIGEMIFAEQRAVIPSAIVMISPDFGRDTPTVDIHGKSSKVGVLFRGAGMALVPFWIAP